MSDLRLTVVGREFDPADTQVAWWCDQNMVWDEGPMPRDCTPEAPHSDESGRCAWALVMREVAHD